MDNKEKIRKALLEFASTLGSTDKTVRDAQKKNIVDTLSESKSKPKKKSSKSVHNQAPLNDQLTSLLSQYTESLGSSNKQHRDETKKQVMELVNNQIHADDHENKQQFKQYIDDIDTIFSPQGAKKAKSKPVISEDLQEYIDSKVSEINQRVQKLKESTDHALAVQPTPSTEVGGGTNAKQLAEGGVVGGNLRVTGTIGIPDPDSSNPEVVELAGEPALAVHQLDPAKPIVQFVNVDASTGQVMPGGLEIDAVGDVLIPGNVTVGGTFTSTNITIGPGDGTGGGATDQHLIPAIGDVYSIGTSGLYYKNLFVRNISATDLDLSNIDAVYINTANLSATNAYTPSLTAGTLNATNVGTNLTPDANNLSLGTDANKWNTLFVQDISASGDVYVSDDIIVGDETVVRGNLRVVGHIFGEGPGGSTAFGHTVSGNYLRITTSSQLSGNVTLGQDQYDNISVLGKIDTNLLPRTGNENIGATGSNNGWNRIYASYLDLDNDLSVLGNTTLGTVASSDTVTFRSQIETDIVPTSGTQKHLGSVANPWGTLYVRNISAVTDATIGQNTTIKQNLAVSGTSELKGDVHIHGDLRVDGNTYLSAGEGQTIYVGDSGSDNVIFHADVDSNILPNTNAHNLGSSSQQWNTLYTQDVSASRNMVVGTNNTNKLEINADITTNIEPDTNFLDIGNLTQPWHTLYVRNISANDNFAVSGNAVIGTDSADTLSINSEIDTHVVPVTGSDKNLGSNNNKWGTLFTTDVSAASAANVGTDLTVARDTTIERNLAVSGTSTLSGDVHIYGDLKVDGNAYLSAGSDGNIYVGDTAGDNVVFRADVDSHIEPDKNVTYNLGSSAQQWKELFTQDISASNNVIINNNLAVSGSSVLGQDTATDTVSFGSRIATHIVPKQNKTHDLGQVNLEWNDLHVQNVSASNNVKIDGDTVIGDTFMDRLYVNAEVDTNIEPVSGITRDLGHSDRPWRTVHTQDLSAQRHITASGNLAVSGYTTLSGDVVAYDDVTIQDNLTVQDNLAVSGYTTLSGDVVAYDNLTVQDNLAVSGYTTLSGDVVAYDNLTVQDNLAVSGYTTLSGDVVAYDNLTVQDNLAVSGYTTLSGDVVAYDNLTVHDNLAVSGYTTLSGDVVAYDNLTIQDNLAVSGYTTLSGDVVAYDNLTVHDNLAVSGYTTLSGDVVAYDNLTVHDNLAVSGYTTLSGDVVAYDSLTVQDNLAVSGYTTLSGDVVAYDNLTVHDNLAVSGYTTLSGDVHIYGDLRVDGNTYLSAGTDGNIFVGDTDGDNVVFRADVDSNILPDLDTTYNLGSSAQQWNTLYVQDLSASDNAYIQNNTIMGTTTADWIRPVGRIDNHLIPRYNDIYNLGTIDRRWDVLYVATARVKDDIVVEDDASILGDMTFGANSASNMFVNALINTNFVPEYGTTLQAYITSASGHQEGSEVGDVANLFDTDLLSGWGISNPVGIFSMDLTISLDIPIPGGIDEYVWWYTTNSDGGTREVQVHDRLTNNWYSMVKDQPDYGSGDRQQTGTLGPAFTAMAIDGFRFEYDNTLSTSHEFLNQYFVVKRDGDIIDWRDVQFDTGVSLGLNTNPWGTAYIVNGNILRNLDVDGNTILGTNNFDTVTFNADVLSNIEPDDTDTFSLGNELQQWKSTWTTSLSTSHLSAAGLVYPIVDGDKRDVMMTDGNGQLSWGAPQRVVMDVRNDDDVDLEPGDPVYAVGEVGGSGTIRVKRAHANDPATMPAIGLIRDAIVQGADGEIITSGVYNTNLTGFSNVSAGDTLYVAATGLTTTKPSGSQLIQNVGQVLKTNGTVIQGIKVSSIDRTNDVPNLSADHIFYGENGYSEQKTLTGAIAQQSLITMQTSNATTILSAGVDLALDLNTKRDQIAGLYNYLISDYTNSYDVSATNIADYLTNDYPSTSATLTIGDVITLSATGDQYILSNKTGDPSDDWIFTTLRPDTTIVDNNLTNGKVIDSFMLNQFKSAKYIIQVEDTVGNEVLFTELSIVSNGTTWSITEYGLNYTSANPFVEFDADVSTGTLSLKIQQANGFNNINNCLLNAKRTNLR